MPDENVVATPVATEQDTDTIPEKSLADDLSKLTGVDWVAKAAEHVLRAENATKDHTLSGADILQKVKALGVEVPLAENTFSQYLSSAAKQIESPITSTGRGRGGGYYLSAQSSSLAKEATVDTVEEPAGERGKEKWLYPALVSWMTGEGYQAKDTSAIRSRVLGKWGNPDVTGISAHEYLSRLELEVVTIEAKLGFDAWEVDFFQAVSQRRFANRAYFAFALPDEAADKLPTDLRYYSERFQVGVLVVDLSNELYERLTSGTLTDDDKAILKSNDGSSVREVLSAPWTHVPLRYQRDVCHALGIADSKSLYAWGGNV